MIQRQKIRHGGTDQWLYFQTDHALDEAQTDLAVDLGARTSHLWELVSRSPIVVIADLTVGIDAPLFSHMLSASSMVSAPGWTADEVYHDSMGEVRSGKPEYSPVRMINDPYFGGLVGITGGLFQQFQAELSSSLLSREGVSPLLCLVLWMWSSEIAVDRLADVVVERSGPPAKVHLHRWHTAVSRMASSKGIEHRKSVRDGRPRIEIYSSNPGATSIIIPTNGSSKRVWGVQRDLVGQCVDSIFSKTAELEFEVVIVYDQATPPAVLNDLVVRHGSRVRLVEFNRSFNFSEKCNLGALRASFDTLCFLNDDTVIDSPDWIRSCAGYLGLPGVGLVGPRLMLEDSRIQSAGHIIENNGVVHLASGESSHESDRSSIHYSGERVGVTFACAFTLASLFWQVGGLCEDLPSSFNDVDYGFKLRSAETRAIWNADVGVYHFESLSRNPTARRSEIAFIESRWKHLLDGEDPYLHEMS